MEVNRATISSGSVGSFRSHTTLPVSSTTHTAVSFTETSRPTKYVIAIAPSSLLEVTVTSIWSSHVEGLRSTYSATQPPRYTIFGVRNGNKQTSVHVGIANGNRRPEDEPAHVGRLDWQRPLSEGLPEAASPRAGSSAPRAGSIACLNELQ